MAIPLRPTRAWRGTTEAALPRYRPLRELLRRLESEIDGPMAMGAAGLLSGRHNVATDMGLAAAGGVGGILAAVPLSHQDAISRDTRRMTTQERRDYQRMQRLLRELQRAQRDQAAREAGTSLGQAQATRRLRNDVRTMNMTDSPYWRETGGWE